LAQFAGGRHWQPGAAAGALHEWLNCGRSAAAAAASNIPQFAQLLVVGRGCQLQEVGLARQVVLIAAAGDLPSMAQLREVGIGR